MGPGLAHVTLPEDSEFLNFETLGPHSTGPPDRCQSLAAAGLTHRVTAPDPADRPRPRDRPPGRRTRSTRARGRGRLPPRGPDVDADVVAVGLELLVERRPFLGHQRHARSDLLGREIEEARTVPQRDDQRVTRADRERIARAPGEGVPAPDTARRAKDARI